MTSYILDLESDALLEDVKTIHCIVLYDMQSKEYLRFPPEKVGEALNLIEQADMVFGHNLISFDLPVITKLHPSLSIQATQRDTLVMSRMVYTNLYELDLKRGSFKGRVPQWLRGSHGLKAWGYRLGILKGAYGEQDNAWETYSPEMLEYCEQDVRVTLALVSHFKRLKVDPRSVELEHSFATIIQQQIQHGFSFDVEKASDLEEELVVKKVELTQRLQEAFPPFVDETIFIPKVNNATRGYVKGVPFIKRSEKEFNPGSRNHVIRALKEKYDYTIPQVERRNKKTKKKEWVTEVTEDTMSALPFPEAADLALYQKIKKIIGMLSEGKQSWLKCVKNGRIHGNVNVGGAATGRCTHSAPNVAQTPSVTCDKETGALVFGEAGGWGADCRSLFRATPGLVLVGADASGLELRCLAHYMAAYDGGKYRDELLNGDIHTTNQKAAGLPTRNQAKTFI